MSKSVTQIARLLLILSAFFLTSCNGFFDKDNTPTPSPLAKFTPQVTPHVLWSVKTGSKIGDEYLKVGPAINGNAIFVAGASGMVAAYDKNTGAEHWKINVNLPLTTSPAARNGLVVVGSSKGQVIALDQATGTIRWKQTLQNELLAPPAINDHKIIVKMIDGTVQALSATDGRILWTFQQVEPRLILRGASAPLIVNRSVLIGFANGNLAKLNVEDGALSWMQTIATPEGAFAIQRMIDVDADPIVYQHHIYAATYQGKISSLTWESGETRWSHQLSSYTGMTADNQHIYISDATGRVIAFHSTNGNELWRQDQLAARIISAPAIHDGFLIVGDAQGYLHWLDTQDGHLVGRAHTGSSIYATPLVESNIAYTLTSSGNLTAYTLVKRT